MQKYDGFLHISEMVDFDTPYSFFFFGFLSHCYGAVGDAAGYLEAYAIPPTPLIIFRSSEKGRTWVSNWVVDKIVALFCLS